MAAEVDGGPCPCPDPPSGEALKLCSQRVQDCHPPQGLVGALCTGWGTTCPPPALLPGPCPGPLPLEAPCPPGPSSTPVPMSSPPWPALPACVCPPPRPKTHVLDALVAPAWSPVGGLLFLSFCRGGICDFTLPALPPSQKFEQRGWGPDVGGRAWEPGWQWGCEAPGRSRQRRTETPAWRGAVQAAGEQG